MSNALEQKLEKCAQLFLDMAPMAGINGLTHNDLRIEYSHNPQKLSSNEMAVYMFFKGEECLKVGKAGRNSNNRYTHHHYKSNSSNSNLAKCLLDDPDISNEMATTPDIKYWMENNLTRANIIIAYNKGVFTLNLLEAFLHCRLQPKYEGHRAQR